MRMQINKTSFVAGVGSAALLGAALMPGLVGAQTTDPTPSATAEASEGSDGVECAPRLGAVTLRITEDLAAALGVTVEELQAAAEGVRDSFADAERPATEEEREARQAEVQAVLAAALGVSVADLEAAKEAVRAEREAEAIARVDEKVADGTLTQEEADAIIERIESGKHPIRDGRPGGRGFGGFGGPRGLDGTAPVMTPDA